MYDWFYFNGHLVDVLIDEKRMKLFLINNAGLIYSHKYGSKLLQILTNDPILIKTHRKLYNKYGPIYIFESYGP